MQLKPETLPVGSIVEVKVNDIWKPTEITIDDLAMMSKNKTLLEYFRPILLTEKILTEWCNAKPKPDNNSRIDKLYNLGNRLLVVINGVVFDCKDFLELNYLHELQLLFSAHKTPLPIQIK